MLPVEIMLLLQLVTHFYISEKHQHQQCPIVQNRYNPGVSRLILK